MPHRLNETRRHKIPRARYRVQNWREYNRALQQRGSLTAWVTPGALAAWQPPRTGQGGRPRDHSDVAIETGHLLRTALDGVKQGGEVRLGVVGADGGGAGSLVHAGEHTDQSRGRVRPVRGCTHHLSGPAGGPALHPRRRSSAATMASHSPSSGASVATGGRRPARRYQ
jgi:hypothetical protein